MDQKSIEPVVFPAYGDVGRADVDTNDESARYASQNGVKYSTGNRAIRHMGAPTCSVTMGLMQHSRMPVNLIVAGKHGSDVKLLEYAYDFEQRTKHRVEPPVTPALRSDRIAVEKSRGTQSVAPILEVRSAERVTKDQVRLAESVNASPLFDIELEARVDGQVVPASQIVVTEGTWSLKAQYSPFVPAKATYGGYGEVVANVVVVLLARCADRAVGKLVLISKDS